MHFYCCCCTDCAFDFYLCLFLYLPFSISISISISCCRDHNKNQWPTERPHERTYHSVRCGTLQLCSIASSLSSSRTPNLNLHCGRQGARLVARDAICDCNGCTLFLFDCASFELAFIFVFFLLLFFRLDFLLVIFHFYSKYTVQFYFIFVFFFLFSLLHDCFACS